MKLTKKQKETLKTEITTVLADIKEPKDLLDIIQYYWGEGLEVTADLLDECIDRKTYRGYSDGLIKILENPPPKKMKPVPKTTVNKNSFNFDFSEWNKADGPDKIPRVPEDIKASVALTLGDMSHRMGKLEWYIKKANADLFRLIDPVNKIIERRKGNESAVKNEMLATMAQNLKRGNSSCPPGILEELYKRWRFSTDQLGLDYGIVDEALPGVDSDNNPVIIDLAPSRKEVWALHWSQHEPDTEVPFPKMKSVFDRMSEGDAFAAYIWGIYSRQYKGRQVFWICGKEGEEGKSFLLKFLGDELFGIDKGFKAITSKQIGGGNQFTASSFVGARLVVFPDCNNPRVLETEMFKMLSGGGRDVTPSEEKFQATESVVIEARAVVLSNFEPAVLDDNWYLSRLALSYIEPFEGDKDPNIADDYLTELPGFLTYAKACYESLCKDHEEIILKDSTKKKVRLLSKQAKVVFQEIFDEYFTLDPTEKMQISKIKTVLSLDETLTNTKDLDAWLAWLLKIQGVEVVRNEKQHRNYYHGVKLKAMTGDTVQEDDSDDDDFDEELF